MRRSWRNRQPARIQGGAMSPSPPGGEPWEQLLLTAYSLIDSVQDSLNAPLSWSLGGGTVLMLRIHHRRSKDIDIFIDNPQLLGLFNPRVTDAAQGITSEYSEGSNFVKLFLPAGEIDIVVAPSLVPNPTLSSQLLDREVQLERSAEIIAKKMWHRGDRVTARDLFDLAAVYELDRSELDTAAPFMARNAHAFLQQIRERRAVLQAEFDAIDRLDFTCSYDECVDIAHAAMSTRG